MFGESQPPQARFGQNQGVEIALLEFADPSLHVAADIFHLQVGADVQQLRPAPQAARADARPRRQPQKGSGVFFFFRGERLAAVPEKDSRPLFLGRPARRRRQPARARPPEPVPGVTPVGKSLRL